MKFPWTKKESSRVQNIWRESVAFHGRPCRTLAIGVRACDTALTHLGLDAAAQMRLVCVTESDCCCVDALQIGLKCTTGTKHLLFYKTGRLIFTVYDLHGGGSVRICTRQEALEPGRTISEILTMPEEALFTFEEAHPMTSRVLNKVARACPAGSHELIPPHFSGLQDSPDAFREFDTQNNDTGVPRRSRF